MKPNKPLLVLLFGTLILTCAVFLSVVIYEVDKYTGAFPIEQE